MAQSMGIKDFSGTAEQNEFLLKKTQYSDQAPMKKELKPIEYDTKGKMIKAVNKSIADNKFGHRPDLIDGEDDVNWWETGINALASAMPYIRPTNQIPLDATQLRGEMFALANNQEEPVYAQTYNPLLSQTTSISLQDQLNQITSQARSAERMAQGDPSALAMIASQAAEAKNKVLGE